MSCNIIKSVALSVNLLLHVMVFAQSHGIQYPAMLKNSYFTVSSGSVQYAFSDENLNKGFDAASISIAHPAVQVGLFGHYFSPYLAAEVSYLRPVLWTQYINVNGDQQKHSVFMSVGTLSAKSFMPISRRWTADGEVGVALVTRKGFEVAGVKALNDVAFTSVVLGGGFNYQLSPTTEIFIKGVFSPEAEEVNQPATSYFGTGFKFIMRPLSNEKAERIASSPYYFPKSILQAGYCNNQVGYEVNDLVSKKLPLFWAGDVYIQKGWALRLQTEVFHTKKFFSLAFGGGAGYWESSKEAQKIFTFSAFPVFRFNLLHSKPADFYLDYSVAGPSYISSTTIDQELTGKHFTFQDFMGMGFFAGRHKRMNVEMNINHYSNGNLFTENPGLTIPLTFNLGYVL